MRRKIPLFTMTALLVTLLGGCQLINALLHLGIKLAPLVGLLVLEESPTPPGSLESRAGEVTSIEEEIERALLAIDSTGSPPRLLSEVIDQANRTHRHGRILLFEREPLRAGATDRLIEAYRRLRRQSASVQIIGVVLDDPPERLVSALARSEGRIQVQASSSVRTLVDGLEPIHFEGHSDHGLLSAR